MAEPTTKSQTSDSALPFPRSSLFAVAGFFILTLLMFADALFGSGDVVLSNESTDVAAQFLSWRKFGFEQLRAGHIPLWNPHIFCGAPYFGGFQAALLYPLNFWFLILPLGKAINWSIATHVFLAGTFVYLWTSYRRFHPLACFCAGVIWMFGGPYFMHIYAGHLTNLCAMVWAPLLFLAIDGVIDTRDYRWTLLGMFTVAMQIFAGHPQYVFYTAFASAIYCIGRLWRSERPVIAICHFAILCAGAVALTSVQLLVGLQATKESIRSVGSSIGFASTYSFPPENFLTFLAPRFFGDQKVISYWGRGGWWEMVYFCGWSGVILGGYGALKALRKGQGLYVLMFLLLTLCALGSNTFLIYILYYGVPGFANFRGSSKLIFVASLFFVFCMALGLDDIIRSRRVPPKVIVTTLCLAAVFALFGWSIGRTVGNSSSWWRGFTDYIGATTEPGLPLNYFNQQKWVDGFANNAATTMYHSALIGVGFSAALIIYARFRRGCILIGFAVVELFCFAHSVRDTFNLSIVNRHRAIFTNVEDHEARFSYSYRPNVPMFFGKSDIWGNDPGIPIRYAQIMTYSQGLKQELAPHNFDIVRFSPLYRALRCRYVVYDTEPEWQRKERPESLPRLKLLSRYRVLHGQKQLFKTLCDRDRGFDHANEVVLESEPSPKPMETNTVGAVRLLQETTDSMDIEADVPAPTILLITDSYSPSWRAVALPGSVQSTYNLMPGDYCLRAVPLAAGHHRLRVEYSSDAFTRGKYISAVSWLAFFGGCAWLCWRRFKHATLLANPTR